MKDMSRLLYTMIVVPDWSTHTSNMRGGGSSKFDGVGLTQYMGGAWGGGLKMPSKNTCDGVHLMVKLPAISLQACKFNKNELLHTYF